MTWDPFSVSVNEPDSGQSYLKKAITMSVQILLSHITSYSVSLSEQIALMKINIYNGWALDVQRWQAAQELTSRTEQGCATACGGKQTRYRREEAVWLFTV